ncbi:MAG TPA: glutamine-hydrolyzing GMP synthase [Candidatus Saccharimonadales bacterium]|nr:glutamine-hydrolyzing GMP synthase [Candidatus Saccharimonadales bacterium]
MVVVFNFGGQFAHLIARRVRDLGVKSELVSPNISISELKKLNPQAIILSGSPFSAYEKNAPIPDSKIYDLGIPILGICYGMQLIAFQLGGKVSNHQKKQFGGMQLKITLQSELFKGITKHRSIDVWFSHGDAVDKLPKNFKSIATTGIVENAGIENSERRIYGIQFHPEVSHTLLGNNILRNFLYKVSGITPDWNLTQVKDEIVKNVKKQIGNDKVLMAVSGGVDSTVAATLIKKASSKNLHLLFINTGLLRTYDIKDLKNVAKAVNFQNFKIADYSKEFIKALKGIVDPEQKRKAIATLYFKVLEEEARKIGNVKFLGQGTIYPDRIESAQPTEHADKIKSHHNVTLPEGLKLEVLEPIADLYKDEVRKLGVMLGIKKEFVNRHPFPGPGLAIRIVGEVTEERLEIVKKVDEIFIEELKENGIYDKVGQALAALLPVKSVGVMGDSRTYSYIVSLRSVDTSDFMTADWSKIPFEVLEKISSRIVNEVRGVNRVVYDITQKPPATIEYE